MIIPTIILTALKWKYKGDMHKVNGQRKTQNTAPNFTH